MIVKAQSLILEQNAEAFERAAFYGSHPVIAAYAKERMRSLKSGHFDFGRFHCEVGAGRSDCYIVDSSTNAGHGRPTKPMPVPPCPVQPPRCDCHVIGSNTLGGNQIGVASLAGRFGTVTLDSGDASYFVPYYIFIVGFGVGADPDNTILTVPLPLLLQDSRSGREPNLRRASTTDPSFGIITTVYGDQKEIECVDWRKFASINNQQNTITLYNPNDAATHAFVDLWGIPAA
jgi:hypothetical protein